MNEADSEKLAGFFKSQGHKIVSQPEEAEVVVINTCSVRQSAEDRVLGLVNNLKKLRIKNYKLKIIVTGCMLRYNIYQLQQMLPDVDEFMPLDKLLIDKDAPVLRQKKKSALVTIMEGCNNFCTYCVVPFSRGREKSRSMKEIICEVKQLVKKGYTQITLLGQNVNSYGGNKFSQLLKELHLIKGLKKISFLTSNPHDLTDEIIEAMKLPKIDRYLHLALQSGDDQILRRMNRKYTARQYLDLTKKIRKAIPEIEIGTDIIVGFPGETKTQLGNTVKLCKKIGFSVAYINKYSPRIGTAAYKLVDNVPMAEKKRRWRVLDKLINKR